MLFKRLHLVITAILFTLSSSSAAGRLLTHQNVVRNGNFVGFSSRRDAWFSVRSEHLLVIGNVSEKELRQVAAELERFRQVVSQGFAHPSGGYSVPTTVIVFRDDASYGPFKTNQNNAGYFQPGQDVNYITLSAEARSDQDPFNITFHEYTHLLINNTFGNPPPWFNEGLAELYSTLSITGEQRVVLGRPIARHLRSLHENGILPLRMLFQVDSKSPYYNDSQKQSVFYAESWVLLHYLMLNNRGERANQVTRFLELLNGKESLDEAFQKAFGITIENMDNDLRSYISQDRYRFVETTIPRKLDPQPQMTATLISEAEVQAYLGDLLVHSNRSEAEIYLQRALTLDPNLMPAIEALGILRYRQRRMSEAITILGRAVEAGSSNALVYYYYASALSRPRENDLTLSLGYAPEIAAKARVALKKAIELRQDFPESYNLLAYVNLVTGTEIDETIELLKAALRRAPGRIDFVYMLGQLYMHNDDYKQARPLLEQVLAGDVEASVREHAQLLLKTMTDIEMQQAQKEAARRIRGLPQSPSSTPDLGQALSDPSLALREALRMPATGETQIQGILLAVDCESSGLIFLVKTTQRVLRLRTDTFQQIRRTTYTADVRGTITCGARKPENPVVVCYFPTNDKREKADGVLSSVEFVPADFKLLP